MAVVLPVLLMLIFGIIDFGFLLNRQILLTQAARESVRAVTVSGDTGAATSTAGSVLSGSVVVASTLCEPDPLGVPLSRVDLRYTYEWKTPLGGMLAMITPTLSAESVTSCAG